MSNVRPAGQILPATSFVVAQNLESILMFTEHNNCGMFYLFCWDQPLAHQSQVHFSLLKLGLRTRCGFNYGDYLVFSNLYLLGHVYKVHFQLII